MAQGYSARAHFPSLTTTMMKASVERPLWPRGEKLRELFRMVFVLTAICSVSALVLANANKATRPAREYQLLKQVEEPSIREVLKGYNNDPIKNRVEIIIGRDNEGKPIKKTIFPAKKDGKLIGLAYASEAHGYHGSIYWALDGSPN